MNEAQFTAVVQSSVRRGEELFWGEIQMPHAGPRGYRTVFFAGPSENCQAVLREVLDWSRRQGKELCWEYQLSKHTTMKHLITSNGAGPNGPAGQQQDAALAVLPGVGSVLEPGERLRLFSLEGKIREGLASFVEVGQALVEIRDSRLYRQSHKTFEDYVAQRWGISARHAYRLVDGAQIATNLLRPEPVGDATNWSPMPAPTAESQVRPLKGLDPTEQKEVWRQASAVAGDSPVTARHVEEAREELHPKQKWPKPNANGVYDKGADCVSYARDGCWARIDLLQLGTTRWAGAVSYDFKISAHLEPITADKTFCTREDALKVFAQALRDSIRETSKSSMLSQKHQRIALKALEWLDDLLKTQDLDLKVETAPVPQNDLRRVLLESEQLIRNAYSLDLLARDCAPKLSTKQLLHLSVALTNLRNFRNSLSQALDPQRQAEESQARQNSQARKAAQKKALQAAAAARWKKAKASAATIQADSGLFLVCRTDRSGRPTFHTANGGWTNNPASAETFPNATGAKFACRHSYDKPVSMAQAQVKARKWSNHVGA